MGPPPRLFRAPVCRRYCRSGSGWDPVLPPGPRHKHAQNVSLQATLTDRRPPPPNTHTYTVYLFSLSPPFIRAPISKGGGGGGRGVPGSDASGEKIRHDRRSCWAFVCVCDLYLLSPYLWIFGVHTRSCSPSSIFLVSPSVPPPPDLSFPPAFISSHAFPLSS